MPDWPFITRLLFLLAILAVVALIDHLKNGPMATRPREYGYLVAVGTMGALLACCIDLITSTLSPEYFIYGKSIPVGAGFQTRVLELAVHAGTFAGMVTAGCFLMANNPKADLPQVPWTTMFKVLLRPAVAVIAIGFIAGILAYATDLKTLLPVPNTISRQLSDSELQCLSRVWVIHAGVYIGLIAGITSGVMKIRAERK